MVNTIKIPADKKLLPFQIETVRKSIEFLQNKNESNGVYVANEQGLGKTVTTLATRNTLQLSPTLIVSPAVMRLTWEGEVYSWCRFSSTSVPKVKVIEHAEDIDDIAGAEFVIISYSLLINLDVLQKLAAFSFELIILDEAHNIKNYKSKRTKSAQALCGRIKYKILLSGTPFSVNVIDGYVPFSLLSPSKFPSYISFGDRYSECEVIKIPKWSFNPVTKRKQRMMLEVKKYFGLKNAEELREIIRSNFYIRYKKDDVLTELPPKIFQKIILPETLSVKYQASEYAKIQAEKALLWESIENDKPIVVPSYIAQHRRQQGLEKVPAITEFVREKLDAEIPIVLFAHHKDVIAQIAEALKEFNPVLITGDTANEDRQEAIRKFQEGETNLFIGNIIAAGTGITLHRSSTVILGELDFVPSNLAQAVDRVSRIGQKNQVIVYFFVVAKSLDEQLEELVIRRTKEFKSVLD